MFQLAYTPYIWPFACSLLISIALATYAFRGRRTPITNTFGWLMVALSFWTLCYTLELLSVTLEGKIFWAQMKYLGNTSGPVLWFVLVLRLTNHEHWLTPLLRYTLIAFCVIVTAVVLTNDLHHWYWERLWIESGFPESQAEQNFFFWIYAIGPYLMILTSVILLFNYYRVTPALYRRQAFWMALGGFIPLASRMLQDIFGLDPFPKIDEIPLSLLLSGIFFALAIFRYGAFKIVHIAHNLVIQNITAGIIVLDNLGRIVDLNPHAQYFLMADPQTLIGRPLEEATTDWPPLEQETTTGQEISVKRPDAIAYYFLQISSITESNGQKSGDVLVLFDITARKLAEQAQQQLAQELLISGQKVAVLEERERIGRELHDDLGQIIGYISVQAQAAQELLQQAKIDETQHILSQLVTAAYEANHNVRQYILGVRSEFSATEQIDELPFTAVLEQFILQLQEQYNFTVQTSLPDRDIAELLAPDVAHQLLRIMQEALSNARKHADVSQAQLFITLHEQDVQAIVADSGRGFNLESIPTPDDQPHFGLNIMRERAESVGGQLEFRTRDGQGTQVIVRLPRVLSLVDEADADDTAVSDLRILLADDHALYSEGLSNLLRTRGINIVGTARNGQEAQELVDRLQPDLVLMDVEMPVCDGLEATKQIKAKHPDIKIVMLTVAADDDKLFDALRYGASGYLLKSLDSTQFFSLLADIMRGETVLSPSLAARVLKGFAQADEPDPELPVEAENKDAAEKIHLTRRQREVLELIAQGKTNKEIAFALNISERTVKYHVGQVLERFQLQDRYELRDYVKDQGLL